MKGKLAVLLMLLVLVAAPFALAQDTADNETTDDSADEVSDDAGDDSSSDANETSEDDTMEDTDETDDSMASDANETSDDEADDDSSNETSEDDSTEETNEELEESLEQELDEELSEEDADAVKEDLLNESATVSSALPGGFSRFLANVGDAFTFNEKAKAQRALTRVRENKLRILKKMSEKQTGFANTKFAAELATLQAQIDADSQKAADAIESLGEDGTNESLADASELAAELDEQELLDEVVEEQASETVASADDLTSEELAGLNTLDQRLAQATSDIKVKVTDKQVKVAAKLVAQGTSVEEIREAKVKARTDKGVTRTETETRTKSRTDDGTEVEVRTKTKTENGKTEEETEVRVKRSSTDDEDDSSESNSGKGNGRTEDRADSDDDEDDDSSGSSSGKGNGRS